VTSKKGEHISLPFLNQNLSLFTNCGIINIMNETKIVPLRGKKDKKIFCRHDYKNAIQVGNVDYLCPLCKELLDPMEWFFMNSFKFVDVTPTNKKSGKPVATRKNFKSLSTRKRLRSIK
jgi:hypothetical protein